jgi:mitochondrial inner membrane protease subunit 2
MLGIVFALVAPPAMVFRNHFYDIIRVTGPSMSPYLNTDFEDGTTGVHDITRSTDRILLKLYRPRSELRRGMVVAFRTPHDPEKWAIKRIVGLQGDRVFPLAHYPGLDTLDGKGLIVPFGHMWVEGDVSDSNKKDASLDSNIYGPVSTGLVIGKATHVITSLFSRWMRIDYSHFKLPGRVQTDAVTLRDPDEEYQSKEFEEMFRSGKAVEILEALRRGLQETGRVERYKENPELLALFDVIRTQAKRQVSMGDSHASEVAASLLAAVDDMLGDQGQAPRRGA